MQSPDNPTPTRLLNFPLAARLEDVAKRIAGLLGANGSDNQAAQLMALFTFAIRVGGAALAYLSQVVLARLLGAHDYGIFAVAWTVVIILGVMACGGFSASASKFIPKYRQAEDPASLRGFIRTSRLSALIAGTGIAALGIAAIALFRPVIDASYVAPLSVTLLALPFFAYAMAQDGIARSHDWPFLAMLPTYIWRPAALLIILVIVIAFGLGATALTAAYAAVLSALLVALYQHMHLNVRLKPSLPDKAKTTDLKLWFLVSLPMLAVDGFLQLITSADVIMVSFFEDPDQVAVYFAASKTLALVHFVYFAVRAASAHRFSRYLHSGDMDGLAAYVRQAVSWTFWPSLAAGAGLLLIAPLLLRLFGAGFEDGFWLIALLMIGVLARASIGPADALLTMTGLQKTCAGIYGATFVLNVVLNLIMIPWLGLAGAAIATSCAILFETTALALAAKYKLNITTFIVPLLFHPRNPAV
ncbi:lipopolysaccharide biosynthesis protein [Roseibium sp.]|uniref:lipopolysaccharide biosynthesis protein n=1 Tax=Roseibium sp. TaxID=1936156 RepID=UPI003B52A3A9